MDAPVRIDIRKNIGLALEWPDGGTSFYPVAYLRRMSPSADMKQLREEMARNPLTILPARYAADASAISIAAAELAGNYALKIVFSDGHATGIYSFSYLREIDPHQDVPAEFGTS